MDYDLSIIIPARNEEFLKRTVEDICKNKRGKTQVIVGLDGQWADPQLEVHPDVVILFYPKSIGQRAISNQCVKLSRAKYIMKVDAHCSFDEGFDVKMMEKMQDDVTMVPIMRNLHAFDWVCPNAQPRANMDGRNESHRRYQSPSGVCKDCGQPTIKEMIWLPRPGTRSVSYTFDRTMHFQYWNDYGKKQEGDLTETLSIQGSCFMLTKDKWWQLDICSEDFHSWGQQGVEVACKTWLSGGRVLVNRTTWYAHLFRTQGSDFSFPYHQPQSDIDANRELSRELFERNKWKGAKYPFKWLLDKFNPPEWESQEPTKGILYYTDNRLNMRLADIVRKNIQSSGLHITSVSLKPTKFGDNFVVNQERGYTTMFKQILLGLENMKEDIVYFCEHDVLYHPDHFKFTPSKKNTFYYNGNYWMLRMSDGLAIHYDNTPLSGLVVYREAAIEHFKERVRMIEELGDGYKPLHMGFEPFTHGRIKWKFWCEFEVFTPEFPNVDIAHGDNATWKRWNIKDFIKKPKFWEETTGYNIPGWDLSMLK